MLFALAQLNPVAGALRQNAAGIRRFYEEARAGGAGLVIYPELALTGSPPQDLLRYSSFVGEAEELVRRDLAPLTASSDTAMLLGTCFRRQGKLYNSVILLKKGCISAMYPKAALENRAPFQESRYFAAGNAISYEQWPGFMAAIAVGEKALEPEYCRLPPHGNAAAADKKRLLIVPAASPYYLGRQQQREKAASALTREQRSALLFVNMAGGSDELVFDGTSLAFNCRGELLRRAPSFAEGILYISAWDLFAPVDREQPASVENITTLHRALTLGIKDYFTKTGFSKALIGLSGGLDSAVTAALAAEALGPENVRGVLLPSEYSPRHSLEDAQALADNLGIEAQTIAITPFFHAYLQGLNHSGGPEMDLAEENLQARIRGDILMFMANRERRLLLTTGNRSELAVGYCTLYGDMAGALAVLADLPKLTVYDLARSLNRQGGRILIPVRTISKPPSAELRPEQKDEDSLPPYDILDPLLDLYLDKLLSPAELIERGFDATTVQRITALVDRAEYKRRQAAPALRVISGLNRRITPIARGNE